MQEVERVMVNVEYADMLDRKLKECESRLSRLLNSLNASLSAHEGSDYFDMAHAVRHAVLVAEGRCPMCYGNDADMPCAYPGEDQPGCLRDIRMAGCRACGALTKERCVCSLSPRV